MKKYLCVGYPNEENIYHQHYTQREEWECYANSREEAQRKAFKHFYYFYEVGVFETKES
jgi:hypothetical protein